MMAESDTAGQNKVKGFADTDTMETPFIRALASPGVAIPFAGGLASNSLSCCCAMSSAAARGRELCSIRA